MQNATTREEIISILNAEMPKLQREFGITKMALFGSFAKGTPTETSDVDLLVESSELLGLKFFELSDYLANSLGRKIDLVTFRQVADSKKKLRYQKIAEDVERNLIYV
jgi:predicted nucleotidyltransferase